MYRPKSWNNFKLLRRLDITNRILIFYFLSLIFYISYSPSRQSLARATSTLSRLTITDKILINCFLLFFTIGLILSINQLRTKIEILFSKLPTIFSKSRLFPNISFTIFACIPSICQHFHNFRIFEIYYKIFRVSATSPNWIDMHLTISLLQNAKVLKIGDEGYIYPSVLLYLRRFIVNFSIEHATIFFALLSLILLNLAIYKYSGTLGTFGRLTLSFLLATPPILLLTDRGNVDILVFAFIVLSALNFHKPGVISKIYVYLLIVISTLLKFYPIIVFFVYLTRNRGKKWARFSPLIPMLLVALLIFKDLLPYSKYQIRDMSGSFGITVLMTHFTGGSKAEFSIIPLFAITILCFIFFSKLKEITSKVDTSKSLPIFFVGNSLYIVAYILSANYYYRLWILLLVIPTLVNCLGKGDLSIFLVPAVLSLFLSPRTTGFLMNLFQLPLLILLIFLMFKEVDSSFRKISYSSSLDGLSKVN